MSANSQLLTLKSQLPSIVPNDDADLYISMPPDVRMEFEFIYEHLKRITSARSMRAACCEVAACIGLNTRQLYERILKYIETHDWKTLVNKAKAGAGFWQATKPV